MDYDVKANLTTILAFIFLPILAGLGVDNVTGMAIVGLLATLLSFVLLYFSEKYTSKYFTVEKAVATCDCEEDAVNPEYYDDAVIKSDDTSDEGA